MINRFGAIAALGAAIGITGTAVADEAAPGVDVYTPDFFAEFRPETALDLVFRTPGFQLDRGDQGRGLAGTQGNVLINGVRPPPRGSSLYSRLSAIRVEDVQRIELIAPGARDIDMQGYDRLINVVTSELTARRVNASWRLEHEEDGGETASFSTGGSVSGAGFSLEGRLNGTDRQNRAYGDFFSVTASDPEPRLALDARNDMTWLDFSGSGAIELGERTRFSVSAAANDMQIQGRLLDDSAAELPAADRIFSLFESDAVTINLSGDLRHELTDDIELSLVAAAKDVERVFDSSLVTATTSSRSASVSQTEEQALRSNLRWQARETLSVEIGASWAFNALDGSSEAYFDGVLQAVDGSAARVEEVRTAALGSAEWTPFENLTVSMGGRVERFELTSSNAPGQTFALTDTIPRATLSYSFDNDWVFRWRSELEVGQLSLGRFLASTDLTNQINTNGATRLEPERTWAHEASLERRFDERGLFRLSASEAREGNTISTVLMPGGELRPANSTETLTRRLRVQLDLPTESVGLDGGLLELEVSARDSERVDPLTGDVRAAAGIAAWSWSLNWRQEIPDSDWIWGVNLQQDGPSERFWLTRIRELDGHNSARAYVEWRPRDDWRGGFSIDFSQARSSTTIIFDDVRAPGLAPVLVSEFDRDQSSQFSAWVEWEVRDGVKLTGSARSGRSRSSVLSVADTADWPLHEARQDFDAVPAVSISLRLNR